MAHGDKWKDIGPASEVARYEVSLTDISTKQDLLEAAKLPSARHYAEIIGFQLRFSIAGDATISRKTSGDLELPINVGGAATATYTSPRPNDCRGDVGDAIGIESTTAQDVTGTIDVRFRTE